MELEPSRRRASLRASDADREQIVFALRQHHGDGRLTVSEFTERMGLAYEAKTLGDLEVLTRDLPPLPPPLPEAPGLDPVSVIRWRFYRHLLSYACVFGPQEIREHPRDRHGDSFDHRSDPWGGHHAQDDRYRRGPDDPRTRPRVY